MIFLYKNSYIFLDRVDDQKIKSELEENKLTIYVDKRFENSLKSISSNFSYEETSKNKLYEI